MSFAHSYIYIKHQSECSKPRTAVGEFAGGLACKKPSQSDNAPLAGRGTISFARIVQPRNGKLEIRGATDQMKTLEHAWMKQFLTQGPLTVRWVR